MTEKQFVVGRKNQLVQRANWRAAMSSDWVLGIEPDVAVICATVEVGAQSCVGVVTDAVGELRTVAAEAAFPRCGGKRIRLHHLARRQMGHAQCVANPEDDLVRRLGETATTSPTEHAQER